jgi:hypothetical protein
MAVEVLGQMRRVFAELYPFNPEVRYAGNDSVSIWLPEFDLYSEGESFDAASWGLVEEALEYVREWEIDLRFAPQSRSARRLGSTP